MTETEIGGAACVTPRDTNSDGRGSPNIPMTVQQEERQEGTDLDLIKVQLSKE